MQVRSIAHFSVASTFITFTHIILAILYRKSDSYHKILRWNRIQVQNMAFVQSRKFHTFLKSPQSLQKIRDSSTNSLSPSKTKSSDLTNFITVYFNFAYFLCCCPFRVISDDSGWFTVRTCIPQKIICAFLNTSALILMLTGLRTKINAASSSKHQNPLEYFGLLSSFFGAAFQSLTLKRFWVNQNHFVEILNFIRSERHILPRTKIRV